MKSTVSKEYLSDGFPVTINLLPKKRKKLHFNIGDVNLNALETPAGALSKDNLSQIKNSRKSYYKMWGFMQSEELLEDNFDRAHPDNFETTHYIVHTSIGQADYSKTLTLRKIVFNAGTIEQNMPDDINFWQIFNLKTMEEKPLWEMIKSRLQPSDKIAVISRACTYPGLIEKQTEEKETTALAFAAAQYMLTDKQDVKFYICQLCPEVQQKVLAINDKNGNDMVLNFQRAEEFLGLDENSTIRLDNKNKSVYEHKLNFPGYWINNMQAAQIMSELNSDGYIKKEDFIPALENIFYDTRRRYGIKLLNDLAKKGLVDKVKYFEGFNVLFKKIVQLPDDPFFRFLTSPTYFKYLVPVMKEKQFLREALIYGAGDGPFSSILIPDDWRKSNVDLLIAAYRKYI